MPNNPTTNKPKLTIEQAIYRNTKALHTMLEPLAVLAARTTDPVHPSSEDVMIALLEKLVEGQEQIRQQLETNQATRDNMEIKQAIKEAINN